MAPLTEHPLSQFYGETRRPLRRYVYRLTGHAADADDIVQDVFCRLLRADVGALPTTDLQRYAFCVARHLVIDRQRHAMREGRLLVRARTTGSPSQPSRATM